MKNFALVLALSLFTLPAFAAELTCTIQSGQKKESATVDLNKEDNHADSEYVYDLSFILEAACEKNDCSANATILSSKVEDEVGQLAFDFKKNQKGRVHGEALNNSPDGRKYAIYCYVK